jgi:hypothetical protein
VGKYCTAGQATDDNIVQPDRPQMTIWRMRIACWIPKATDTHSEFIVLIAFPRQQWLRERPSMLQVLFFLQGTFDIMIEFTRNWLTEITDFSAQ